MNTAPPHLPPKIVQTSMPGCWTGESSFITRQPRRVELKVQIATVVLHLPLGQMDRMVYEDQKRIRNFAMILAGSIDFAIRIICDLQHQDPARRIAATLDRSVAEGRKTIVLTQKELGEMARATRRQVNSVLGQFAERGWVRLGYGAITVMDVSALREFVEGEK